MSESVATSRWTSSFAFYLAAIGAAVGLGSIWRFPYLAGSSGGSAFVFVFVCACTVIAIPLLVAEYLIGRRSRLSPPQAAGAVAGLSGGGRGWNAIGVLGTIASFLVISYYTVLAGWVTAYAWRTGSGLLVDRSRAEVAAMWRDFLASPWEIAGWHLAFMGLVAWISARGINRGIEWINRIRAPVLLGLMLILVAYALATGDVRRGLGFAFAPNFAAITPQIVLAAVGQAFYATGVGMAMMIAYGAYLSRDTSLVRSSLIVSGSILLVSLLSTLLVFPLVFKYGMDPAQGVDLVFDVLASVFAEMPAGRPIGTLFFVMLIFAALTPSIAGIEPVVAWFQERFRLSRVKAVLATTISMWLAGIGSVLSFNLGAHWRPLGWLPGFSDKNFFVAADYIASNVLLPIGALLTCLLVGWRLKVDLVRDELSETTHFAREAVIFLLRYVCPIALLTIVVTNFV